MKLRKIALNLSRKTGYPFRIYVAKNTRHMYELIAKDGHWTVDELEECYKKYINDNQDEYSRGPAGRYVSKSYESETLGGVQMPSCILINKCIEKQTKEFIQFLILHEIGHHFNGPTEKEANDYAMEWMEKI